MATTETKDRIPIDGIFDPWKLFEISAIETTFEDTHLILVELELRDENVIYPQSKLGFLSMLVTEVDLNLNLMLQF